MNTQDAHEDEYLYSACEPRDGIGLLWEPTNRVLRCWLLAVHATAFDFRESLREHLAVYHVEIEEKRTRSVIFTRYIRVPMLIVGPVRGAKNEDPYSSSNASSTSPGAYAGRRGVKVQPFKVARFVDHACSALKTSQCPLRSSPPTTPGLEQQRVLIRI